MCPGGVSRGRAEGRQAGASVQDEPFSRSWSTDSGGPPRPQSSKGKSSHCAFLTAFRGRTGLFIFSSFEAHWQGCPREGVNLSPSTRPLENSASICSVVAWRWLPFSNLQNDLICFPGLWKRAPNRLEQWTSSMNTAVPAPVLVSAALWFV